MSADKPRLLRLGKRDLPRVTIEPNLFDQKAVEDWIVEHVARRVADRFRARQAKRQCR